MTTATPELADPSSPAPADGRHRILDVAAALFRDHGYPSTSMRDIADHAGIKAGSIYYHFASKAAILTAVFEHGINVMHEAFEAAAAESANERNADRLATHVRAHLAALFEHGPYTAAHVEAFRTAPDEVRDVILPRRDHYEARWTALLTELSGAQSVTLARLSLFGAMNATSDWYDPARGNLDRVATAISTQFWHGFAATYVHPREGAFS